MIIFNLVAPSQVRELKLTVNKEALTAYLVAPSQVRELKPSTALRGWQCLRRTFTGA